MELGPLVVADDGTYRYISNWAEMTDAEREVTKRRITKRNAERLKRLRGGFASSASGIKSMQSNYDGWSTAVWHKPAAPGHEDATPLLLIHPVGIGLSQWFWEPFLDAWSGAEVWSFDLIGCGESEEWNPDEKGLFIPLDWVRQAERVWQEHIRKPVLVFAQGGLAPIAVSLAARESDSWSGSRAVASVVLASPPTWSEMVKELDSEEVQRNFDFLASPAGTLSYRLLRTRAFVEFFSNLFLFDGDRAVADERWLTQACEGATLPARWPVNAFNAGLVGRRALEEELRGLSQPLLVLSGEKDKRVSDRRGYEDGVPTCRLEQVAGCNVLPWEAPAEVASAVAAFARTSTSSA